MDKLISHNWPGNVRELRNVLERAIIFSREEYITLDDLAIVPSIDADFVLGSGDHFRFTSGGTLEELECAYIRHILKSNDVSYAEVARILGISKKTLWEKRKRYNLDKEEEKLELAD